MARPITFRTDLADAILRNIESGDNVSAACRRAGVARSTFSTWGKAGRGQIADRLAGARAKSPTRKTAAKAERGQCADRLAQATPAANSPASSFAIWQQANADRLAARARAGQMSTAPVPDRNSERPEITVSYSTNHAALLLVARVLEAIAAELRRAT